ncbi:SAC3/GANP/Nin1/mts3/eIF-3 p25 family-domain-containing protein [Geranomyces variabilis]|nr:SAC3/GANP/Nin1/mts3/eIF-3 p25 family-domain-containing protein [Geranomyces variabilis]KAJ3131551.1 hypothetical protein HDU90_008218 [Geranomyces variabilis]
MSTATPAKLASIPPAAATATWTGTTAAAAPSSSTVVPAQLANSQQQQTTTAAQQAAVYHQSGWPAYGTPEYAQYYAQWYQQQQQLAAAAAAAGGAGGAPGTPAAAAAQQYYAAQYQQYPAAAYSSAAATHSPSPSPGVYDWNAYGQQQHQHQHQHTHQQHQHQQHAYGATAETQPTMYAQTSSAPSSSIAGAVTVTARPAPTSFGFGNRANAKPVYTTVKARTVLKESPLARASADGTSPTTAPAEKKPAVGYPDSLKAYVTRCQTSMSAQDWPAARAKIYSMISTVMNQGALYTTNWDTMPLPSPPQTKPASTDQPSDAKKRKTMATNSLSSNAAKSPRTSSSSGLGSSTPTYASVTGGDGLSNGVKRTTSSWDVLPTDTAKMSIDKRPAKTVSTGPAIAKQSKKAKAAAAAALKAANASNATGSDEDEDSALLRLPPSQRAAELERRALRKNRFQGRDDELQRAKADAARIARRAQEAFIAAGAEGNPDVIDWDEDTIIGTCQTLEKRYLRLTSAPDPASVRPLAVLRRTLELLISKWKAEQNYTYICDQFKSMRQDLTVQRIKNDFTVVAYETHARIALEKSDLGEYNQCQAQLLQLYKLHNLPGHVDEFTGYRILYFVHTSNRTQLINQISELSDAAKAGECVQHALNVRTAVATGDYHRLFELYHDAPKMSSYMMDQFLERERVRAMKTICKAYRPSIPVSHLACELGWIHPQDVEDDNAAAIIKGRKDCARWLKMLGAGEDGLAGAVVVWVDGKPGGSGAVDCKESLRGLLALVEQGKRKGVDIKGQIH